MSKSFIFFLIVAMLAGVALWGFIGSDGQQAVRNVFSFPKKIEQNTTTKVANVRLGETVVRAEVADTAALREKGLSGRLQLGANEGMLFIFDGPGKYSFWMKEMNFPIDIAWINNNQVVEIRANAQPSSGPIPETFVPTVEASRVLEVRSGFLAAHGIIVGTPVSVGFDGS